MGYINKWHEETYGVIRRQHPEIRGHEILVAVAYIVSAVTPVEDIDKVMIFKNGTCSVRIPAVEWMTSGDHRMLNIAKELCADGYDSKIDLDYIWGLDSAYFNVFVTALKIVTHQPIYDD